MRSFNRQPDNRRSIYLQLAGSIESQIRQAYAECHEESGLTQSGLAEKLGVDRSVVHRRLSGRSNMTIETIADMIWALGRCIHVNIFNPLDTDSNDFMIVPSSLEPRHGELDVASTATGRVVASPEWQLLQ